MAEMGGMKKSAPSNSIVKIQVHRCMNSLDCSILKQICSVHDVFIVHGPEGVPLTSGVLRDNLEFGTNHYPLKLDSKAQLEFWIKGPPGFCKHAK